MVINTLKHNYYVIHKLNEDQEFETHLCYEVDKNTQNRYRVLRLKSKDLTYQLISVFMELKEQSSFTDFYDCFSKDGFLYLVFLHNDYPLLVKKLDNERCELKERLEIGKTLLEHILMLNMPDFILYDALSESGVTVSPALEVQFNYSLTSIRQYQTIGISEVKKRICILFTHLFEYELKKEASGDIEDFITELKELEFKNYFEIFKKYEALYEKLSTGDLIQKIKPHTFLFRLWDRIKGLGKYVKPLVSAAIVLLIAGYLIYSIMNKKVDEATVFNFEQIGTVTIDNGTGK
jgi:hypothetical protein